MSWVKTKKKERKKRNHFLFLNNFCHIQESKWLYQLLVHD